MSKKKISNDEILQVALQLIDENGLDNLQMKDIAARLKIKSASLYKHFKNYDDVVINLYIFCLIDFRKYIEDRNKLTKDFYDKLKAQDDKFYEELVKSIPIKIGTIIKKSITINSQIRKFYSNN